METKAVFVDVGGHILKESSDFAFIGYQWRLKYSFDEYNGFGWKVYLSINPSGRNLRTHPTHEETGHEKMIHVAIKLYCIDSETVVSIHNVMKGVFVFNANASEQKRIFAVNRDYGYSPKNVKFLCVFDVEPGKSETLEKLLNGTQLGQKRVHSALATKLPKLFQEGKLSDLKISVEGKEILAHKVIIGASSPIFMAMFKSDTTENRKSLIKIDDFNYNTIKAMVTFMYSGEVPQLSQLASTLLVAANKYQVAELGALCETSLSKDLKPGNALEYLHLSDSLNAVDLKSNCIAFICKNLPKVTTDNGWKSFHLDSELAKSLLFSLKDCLK